MNRPGYYERNTAVFSENLEPSLREKHIQEDQKRMEALIPKIARALPFPKDLPPQATPSEYLQGALKQFIDNVALQYAAAYARQIYHGATSTSNILIDGRFLDFGTAAAVPGYRKIRFIPSDGANGETSNLKSDLIFELLKELRKELPDRLKSGVPSEEVAGQLLDDLFTLHLQEQFLILAGTPKELAPEALSTRDGQEFAKRLINIAQDGNDKIIDGMGDDNPSGTYNLGQVLQSLIKKDVSPPSPMKPADWESLSIQFSKYHNVLTTIAIQHGIAPTTLSRAIEIGVRARNSTMNELRGQNSMWTLLRSQSLRFSSGKDKFAVQNLIDETVERNVHEFKTAPYNIEVATRDDITNGKVTHRILDLKTGHEEIVQSELPGFRAAQKETNRQTPKLRRHLKFIASCVRLLFL